VGCKTMPALDIEEVTTTEALEKLRPEWSALWARCPTATPFQSPEWLIPWWRYIGAGELWTLALRQRGYLVGLAPFYIYMQPGSSEREVFPVGIATTDYLDVLLDPEFASCGAATVFAHLDAAWQRWDVRDLQQLRPQSALLHATMPAGWSEELTTQEPCPTLTLPDSLEELSALVPAHLRKNLRYYWRRAEKIGQVRVESADQHNLDALLESLLQLHHSRWAKRGLTGVLAPEAVQNAQRETAAGLLSRGLLRLYGLRLADRLVASFYGFTHIEAGKKRAYFYLGGFDPVFAYLSVGTLVIDYAIRAAVREGAAEFDFLRGREAYKYRWGATDRLTYRRRLRNKPASGLPSAARGHTP
jgi:CelD/BcsL family acetyltransferase involved in cellulose biosynthesis